MNFFFLLVFLAPLGEALDYRRLSQQENQNLKSYCGTKPTRQKKFSSLNNRRFLYGGNTISGNSAPWAVRFVTNGQVSRPCSATIISPRHILSASHCLMKNDTEYSHEIDSSTKQCDYQNDLVITQDNELFQIYNERWELLSKNVAKFILLNYCIQKNYAYDDFMIIELKNDISFNDFAFPACVINDFNSQSLGTWVNITGYGHNNWDFYNLNGANILREGSMQIIQFSNGNRNFDTSDRRQKVVPRPGDSGGSALSQINGRHCIVGVTSTSPPDNFFSSFSSVWYHFNRICAYTGVC